MSGETSTIAAIGSADPRSAAVRVEPRGVRCTSATPVCASIARIRAETACWLTPACRAAPFRLPVPATPSSTSSADRSGTCVLSVTAATHSAYKPGLYRVKHKPATAGPPPLPA